MSATPRDRLYATLPAFVRQRDGAAGQPLRALLRVLEEPLDDLAANAAELYDSWFIETCEDWVVPYLADLLGIHRLPVGGQSARAYVANTLAYRRRKGTLGALERLAWDLAGWPALAVELERRVLATPHLRASSRPLVADLRRPEALSRPDGPFDGLSRTVDLRPLGQQVPRAQLRHVGLFVWRLHTVRAVAVPACERGAGSGRFTFHPRGWDTPLFQAGTPGALAPAEHQVPGPLRPLALATELARRASLPPAERIYFGEAPVFTLRVRERSGGVDRLRLLTPEELLITDLGPSSGGEWTAPTVAAWTGLAAKAAVDPQRGRILLNKAALPQAVGIETSFVYAAAGEIGAGAYPRTSPDGELVALPGADGARELPLSPARLSVRLAARPPERLGDDLMILLSDSASYTVPAEIQLAGPAALVVQPADGCFPTVQPGDTLTLRGAGRLHLCGLLLPADLNVTFADSGAELELDQCTFEKLTVSGPGTVRLHRCQGLGLSAAAARVEVRDSTLHEPGGGRALQAATLRLERSTILGRVEGTILELCSDSVLTGLCTIDRSSVGGVRFSLLPTDSVTPPRYRCVTAAAGAPRSELPVAAWSQWFASTQRGQPGYATLRIDAPAAARSGASDGGELGAFGHLQNTQREAALRDSLQEYVRAGYTAAIYYAT